ncbi:MAG: hypothetical protein OXR73_24925 [Myxococcales bacterium]|nr:hypothetical protein [Myxococcales bacterium]
MDTGPRTNLKRKQTGLTVPVGRVHGLILPLLLVACHAPDPDGSGRSEAPAHEGPGPAGHGALAGEGALHDPEVGVLPGRPALCARDRDDAVRDVFCAPTSSIIGSLTELQQALGLQQVIDLGPDSPGWKPVAVLGHSTALSGHRVSPINPRLIMMGGQGGAVLMAYQRGVQKVESWDRPRSMLPGSHGSGLESLIQRQQSLVSSPDSTYL